MPSGATVPRNWAARRAVISSSSPSATPAAGQDWASGRDRAPGPGLTVSGSASRTASNSAAVTAKSQSDRGVSWPLARDPVSSTAVILGSADSTAITSSGSVIERAQLPTPEGPRSSCSGSLRRPAGRPAAPSRSAWAAWRRLGAGAGAGAGADAEAEAEAGADDALAEKSWISASRYASVQSMAHHPAAQRSSWMRTRLPAGSRKAQSRIPYGCSVGSWTTSASPACSRSNVPSRSLVARRIQP